MELAVEAALAAGNAETALELSERGRARAFVDQLELGHPQMTPEAVGLASAVAKAQDRRRLLLRLVLAFTSGAQAESPGGLAAMLRELSALGVDIGQRGTPVTAEQVSRELTMESDALRRLEARLQAASLGERESIAGTVASVRDIRDLLSTAEGEPRVLLAEYFILDENVVLFLLGADASEVQGHIIDRSEPELRASVQRWLGPVSLGRTPDLNGLDVLGPLVEPVLRACEPGDLVCFVPHGILHYVPLHAVKVVGKHLVERNPVIYAPSASVLAQCRARRAGRSSIWRNALVLGDSREDLPHARNEAFTVAELFGVPAYVAGAARKSLLIELRHPNEGDPDVIHLACHGVFDGEHPLRSGILLASYPGDHADDATLTAEEVYGLRLEAGLVTLSACQSGLNVAAPGEELIGLTRAFMYSGAAAVLVSLWSVDDLATGMLMEDFYKRLLGADGRAQARPTEALRGAQIQLMRTTAREAIDRLDERLAQTTDPRDRVYLRLDVARLRVMAGDLSAAVRAYAELHHELDGQPSPLAALIEQRLRLIRFKSGAAIAADYSMRPFEHPRHWAAFSLAGEWR